MDHRYARRLHEVDRIPSEAQTFTEHVERERERERERGEERERTYATKESPLQVRVAQFCTAWVLQGNFSCRVASYLSFTAGTLVRTS